MSFRFALLLFLLHPLLLSTVGCKSHRQEVIVLAAASLARSLSDLEQSFEADNPDLDIQLEISGSQVACRKVSELNRRADVVATADYRVIDDILRPAHAAFTLQFATNEVVLAHMQHSKYTETITRENWPEILLRKNVRLGTVDPDLAPIGYHTLILWQLVEGQQDKPRPGLAAKLRAKCAAEHVAVHESELLQLLQSRAIDYAFVYRSTAEEHNLKVVSLPDRYNLGSLEHQRDYAKASVPVQMRAKQRREIHGAAITYGLTLLKNAPNPKGAARFVTQLLGSAGQRTLKRTGFRPLTPPRVKPGDQLPVSLKALVR